MTHNERVLALLADGRWHSHHEIYDLHVIGHSRVSDLRKLGHRIDQRRQGDLYLYRWNGGPLSPPAQPIPDHSPSRSRGEQEETPWAGEASAGGESGQLTIGTAA